MRASLSGDSPTYLAEVGVAYAADGKRAEAWSVIDHLRIVGRQDYVSSYGLAQIYVALNDDQNVLKYLQVAYDEGAIWLQYLQVDPILDHSHSHPRFHDLVRQMGLQ